MGKKPSTRLVLICGLPASGKTTLARRLAPEIGAIRLDKDQWTATPMTTADFEQWAAIFQPPDEAELELFDPPLVAG